MAPKPVKRSAKRPSKPHVLVMFTGGTISMKIDPLTAAAIPALSGRDIVSHRRIGQQGNRRADLQVAESRGGIAPHRR